MSEMKRHLDRTEYERGYNAADYYMKCNYGYDDSRLWGMNHALSDFIRASVNPDYNISSSYTYGYLDAISKVLGELIEEARTETITTYIKEEENGSGEDDSGSEGSTLSGDRDDNGEAGGAEDDSSVSDGQDQASSEAN